MIQGDGHYPHQVPVDAYGDGGFRFAEMSHRGSILCLPSGMHAWDMPEDGELTLDALKPVLEEADHIEVLFIGMGSDTKLLAKDIREGLKANCIVVEAIGTGSAISIYNILLSEQRAVAAALIATERDKRT